MTIIQWPKPFPRKAAKPKPAKKVLCFEGKPLDLCSDDELNLAVSYLESEIGILPPLKPRKGSRAGFISYITMLTLGRFEKHDPLFTRE